MIQPQSNQVVYLNGKPLEHCIVYDIALGIARCHVYKDGALAMDGEHRATVIQVEGKITIEDAVIVRTHSANGKSSRQTEEVKEE